MVPCVDLPDAPLIGNFVHVVGHHVPAILVHIALLEVRWFIIRRGGVRIEYFERCITTFCALVT